MDNSKKMNLIKRYKPEEDLSPEIIAAYLINEFPSNFSNINLAEKLSHIENVIETRAFITEEEFLDHYFFLKNIGTEIS